MPGDDEEVTPRRTLLVPPEGKALAGQGRPHLEYPTHTVIMAVRPDVGAVVHTHGPAAVTFASLGVPLLPLSHDAVPFADPDVPRHPSGRLISDRGLGARLAASLGGGAGCLMVSHGLVTVGSDPASAVMYAVLLERACAIQLRAPAAGGPTTWSDADEVAQKRAETWSVRQLSAGYARLCRKAFPSEVGRFSPEAPIPTE
ncbi:class II aldolase/adducin family protein [Streptomyces acidicola]|uniref:class II aldolase/adducin family protein n=1 Tax=Streptomyces acidicola TaxID=2596892 RepID=UPI00344064A5